MEISEELKENYWRTIRRTRASGRVSPSVVAKTEEKWKKYDTAIVRQALEIHISRYSSYKENYTLGIMRNLQRCKDNGAALKRNNSFHRFEQKDYDFEALEKELLAN